ncbi:TetR/AcrR family transcriptional regulator [Yinghuangia seranimata]|uniref:TetR/AcrR family transcriptional regulator n=1 Tax=Yinghuangia seranimata TaxID=408067 RepID=UPI00248AD70B|nr:TetR/AcrR family transcriptional regulator [Yinghuangia seranimata]MDI2132512.1 helix-turn-helix domain-containing protein [Yinghuangia seranimata]
MAPPNTTITLTRALTRDQQARRERLVKAALDLAAEGGYTSVTMHDVADRAGVARATVYRYFTSKDHLLSEVSALWIGQVIDELTASELPADPAGRLAGMLCRLVEVSAENRLLTEAILQAATSPDPSAEASHQTFAYTITIITDTALGAPEDEAARAHFRDLQTVLGHVLLSGLLSLSHRGRSTEEVQELMRTAVRLVL